MIPCFQFPSLQLGPFTLQSFGIFAAAGGALAAWLLVREAERAGLDPSPMRQVPIWALVGGMVGGHVMHVLFYQELEIHVALHTYGRTRNGSRESHRDGVGDASQG